MRTVLAEKQKQSSAIQRTHLKAGKVWLALPLVGSDRPPRFLAWQENFRGLELPAVLFSLPLLSLPRTAPHRGFTHGGGHVPCSL